MTDLWTQYRRHRNNCQGHGVAWNLTYEEWLAIWQASGHLHERGRRRGQYCMIRVDTQGAYEPNNVEIVTVDQACRRLYKDKPSHRRGKQGSVNQGVKRDAETRQRMSLSQRAKPSPKRRVPLPVMTPYGPYTSVAEASEAIGISPPGIYYHLRVNPKLWHYID